MPSGLTRTAVIATVPSADSAFGSTSRVGASNSSSSEGAVNSWSWSSSPGLAMTKYRPPRSHGAPRRGAVSSAVVSSSSGAVAGSAARYGADRAFCASTKALVRSASGSSR